MRISKENSDLMVITNWNFLVLLIGIIFCTISIIAIISSGKFDYKIPLWLSILGFLFGLFVILNNKITRVIIDREKGILIFIVKSLYSKQEEKEYDLSQIRAIELKQMLVSRDKDPVYKLAFVLRNGKRIFLNPHSTSRLRVMGERISNRERIGRDIAAFLNIPFNKRRIPTVRELLSTLKDAIIKGKKRQKPDS